MARDFRKIRAWELADDLAVKIYRLTKGFPSQELYGLVSQLRRAVVSVPANIAEGSNRGSKNEYLHFLHIAAGSLAEVEYYLHLAARLEYLSDEEHRALEEERKKAGSTLQGLIKAVKSDIDRK